MGILISEFQWRHLDCDDSLSARQKTSRVIYITVTRITSNESISWTFTVRFLEAVLDMKDMF